MSLLALGGANAVVPEMHRQAVELRGWMSEARIHRHVRDLAGRAGAERDAGDAYRLSRGRSGRRGRYNLGDVRSDRGAGPFSGQDLGSVQGCAVAGGGAGGLVPISVGLVGASAIVLTRAADHSWVAVVITVATAAAAFWTRWNPLWLIGIAGSGGSDRSAFDRSFAGASRGCFFCGKLSVTKGETQVQVQRGVA